MKIIKATGELVVNYFWFYTTNMLIIVINNNNKIKSNINYNKSNKNNKNINKMASPTFFVFLCVQKDIVMMTGMIDLFVKRLGIRLFKKCLPLYNNMR